MIFRINILLIFTSLAFTACSPDQPASEKLSESFAFELLRQAQTGLTFKNTLTLTPEFNVFNYMYFYNGGGLAAGDFNGDGLIDLYFTSNQEDNALYLNDGDPRFREVTEAAGVMGQPGWATGASVVDINNDGLLDIYVSQVGDYLMLKGTNQLYVNQGNDADGVPTFRDEAAAYGLDLVGFGTQATFFDYDGDGDLDMYQLNHSLHQNGTFGKRKGLGEDDHPLSGDKLLRNDGGTFTEVSRAAGIRSSVVGYGLGVATGDVNNDGWPDLYVANDFHENDYLYLNNRDGTFREVLTEQMQHTSRFAMGVDIGDINNDGRAEIFTLDMLPEDPTILKASLGEDGYDVFKFKLGFGYNPQFSRNTLQLNNGNGSFSEIGAFAGVHASDWSWGPLMFDMDHDGRRDLFVSNGIPRRMNDIDYINFKTNDELQYREAFNDIRDRELEMVEKMPEIKLRNKFYRNGGDLRFADLSDAVTGAAESYSGSSVYVDLDNDGDLDVVTNNIDDEPFVYRNLTMEEGGAAGAMLRIRIEGSDQNRMGVGTTLLVFAGDERLRYEHYPTRGYQSSALGPLYAGIGDTSRVDSLLLVWPDRTYQRLTVGSYAAPLTVTWRAGLPTYDFARFEPPANEASLPIRDVTAASGLGGYLHEENPFVDFNREPLIPHMVSAEGPAVATGDLNGDGRTDLFLGSSKRRRSAIYLQNADGTFTDRTPADLVRDSVFEDVDAVFVDLENDGDLDLVVAAGGNEYQKEQEPRLQRTYLNDGTGRLTREDVLPPLFLTASRVLAQDVNGDGLTDLFFAGRVVPWNYGKIPPSHLLINRGNNRFEDQTAELAPALATAGLVTDAAFSDLDGDGDPDLLLALEWGPVTVYRNDGGRFTPEPLTDDTGWWTSLLTGDFDGDGDVDVLAGNFGTNNKLQPSPDRPLRMYVNDFDGNEKLDQVLTYYVKGREIPFASHAELIKQMPALKKRYLYAQDMARDDLPTLFGRDELAAAERFEVTTLASTFFRQRADGTFTATPLPDAAQLSSIHALARLPAGDGGAARVLFGGNFLKANIEMGWYDAGWVRALEFSAGGELRVRDLAGPAIRGAVRGIGTVDGRYLVVRNGEGVRLLAGG